MHPFSTFMGCVLQSMIFMVTLMIQVWRNWKATFLALNVIALKLAVLNMIYKIMSSIRKTRSCLFDVVLIYIYPFDCGFFKGDA